MKLDSNPSLAIGYEIEQSLAGKAPISKKIKLFLAGILLTAAFIGLLIEGATNSIIYFRTASQAVADRASLKTSTFQIEGTVVPSSITHKSSLLIFSISSGKTVLPVHFRGTIPELFQPGIPVVLVGSFAPGNGPGHTSYLFLSSQMLIKHSSTYIAKYPNRVKAYLPNSTKK
jgi:cytochrome c-type biogenesis protein CcmE